MDTRLIHCATLLIGAVGVVMAVALSGCGKDKPSMSKQKIVTVRFKQTDKVFANPGKGWMAFYRMPPPREPRLPYAVTYFRLNWGDIEPTEGEYDWALIDDPIKAWSKHGTRVAFRIMTANAHTNGYYCSPKWLFDAGCNSYEYVRGGPDTMAGGKRIKRIEPDYGDPIYLKKHGAFIKALAKRYDGHAGVEFIDIGSYGIWGEWHTKHDKDWTVKKQIIDMYLNAFGKTPLLSMSDNVEALAYAIARGAGVRRDGVGSPWHEKNWIGSKRYAEVKGFADQWKRAPVVFEWYGPYDFLMRRKWSFDSAVEFMLKNHVTYICDNIKKVPAEQMPKLRKLARLSGYRFVLREVSHPASVSQGQVLKVRMKWSNVGVGKLYRRYPLVIYLLDAKGKVVCSEKQAKVDSSAWLPGDYDLNARIKVPAILQAGEYTLGVALIDPQTKKPAIRLGVEVPHTGRIHHIGRVTVK